ncbi:MAG TPA: DUF1800 domain-containing protein [Bacteroidia bacterium]|jgi:uncharacterized protein (DUF1800 family)|nr:DUF1800 domain-containing protein [Bacteroidia bacterium]
MRSSSEQKKIQHLFSRAAFGISVSELNKRSHQRISDAVEELFNESGSYTALSVLDPSKAEAMNAPDMKALPEAERKKLRQERKRSLLDLNLAWLEKLWTDPARLRERMAFFWHGHFACRVEAPYAMQELNNIHRQYALGPFRDLLMAVSKSAAMLQFLNNQQNRKMHPNENFAREVMELFTIGRGHYTENDIREGARAFTGWGFEKETGSFVFREKAHDGGEKVFMGKTGNFQGEEIIDIILARKDTAVFLTRKICRFFVNDMSDEKIVAELADSYFASGYDTGALMRTIFLSDWFYKPENIGALIKSPVDLIVGINRQISVNYDNKDGLILFQRALGQMLFYPPNVSGWAGGKSWIDSSSLMFRLKIASLILNEGHIEVQPKDDLLDDKQYMVREQKRKEMQTNEHGRGMRKFHPQPDWNAFLASLPKGAGKEELISLLLLPQPSQALLQSLKVEDTKALVMELLSTPEYQMA